MASAIRSSRSLRAKVLLLNPTNDRETHGYSAADYINAIAQTLNRSVQRKPAGCRLESSRQLLG